jgi:hypothetical protein
MNLSNGLITCCVALAITGLQGYALYLGHNGQILTTTIAVLSAMAGFAVGRSITK